VRSTVLSSDERRMWDDIERCYGAEIVSGGFAVGAVTAGAALLRRYWPLLHG
jgi:hypothetical protein